MSNNDLIKLMSDTYEFSECELSSLQKNDLNNIRKFIGNTYSMISNFVFIDFHNNFTYESFEDMKNDFNNGILKISTKYNFSPVLGDVYNLLFRASHDYFHLLLNEPFSFDGELKVYKFTCNLTNNQLIHKVLRSEILYQSCYSSLHNGEFIMPQKLILKDFHKDFKI